MKLPKEYQSMFVTLWLVCFGERTVTMAELAETAKVDPFRTLFQYFLKNKPITPVRLGIWFSKNDDIEINNYQLLRFKARNGGYNVYAQKRIHTTA